METIRMFKKRIRYLISIALILQGNFLFATGAVQKDEPTNAVTKEGADTADDGTGKRGSLTLFPVTTILGTFAAGTAGSKGEYGYLFSMEGEYSLGKKISLTYDFRYAAVRYGSDWDTNEYVKKTYCITGPGIRYYPAGNALQGMFLGLYEEWYIYNKRRESSIRSYSSIASRGLVSTVWVGYRAVAAKRFFWELSTGVMFYNLRETRKTPDTAGYHSEQKWKRGFFPAGIGFGTGIYF